MKQKRFQKLKNGAAILMAIAMLGPLASCSKQPEKPENKDTNAYYQNYVEPEKPNDVSKSQSLADINPTFKPYKDNIAMDEESVLKIIRIAMADAQKFYTDMGAPNMTYDKNLNIVNGKDNFYPEWMDEYFYMGKAMSESSFRVDVVTDIKSNPSENDAYGMMQICPQSLKQTLEQYYQSIFGVNVDLSNLNVVPSQEDLDKAYYSKEAQANIVKSVYNNVYLAVCYDIYNVKCLNPVGHKDYYAAYGGFSEDIRRLASIGLYGIGRQIVLTGLKNGTLEKDLRSIEHMNIYLNNIAKYEKQFENKYSVKNEVQPER